MGPELGPGAPRQQPTGHFPPLFVRLPFAHVAPVLEPEAEHHTDIILLGSSEPSELSSPASPGPSRGEVSSLRRSAPGLAVSEAPGFWNSHTSFTSPLHSSDIPSGPGLH